MEYSEDTNILSSINNVYLNGVRIAALNEEGTTAYFLTDQVDSVAHVLDEGAHTLSRMQYEPYGETLVQRGNQDLTPKYNSQELDRETNFYFYNARYYDPQIARFTSADTVIDGARSTQGWNRFSYVAGNPIRYKDPTGHVPCISICIESPKTFKKGEVNQILEKDLLNEKDPTLAKGVRDFLQNSKLNAKSGIQKPLKMPEILIGSKYYYKLRHIDAENRGIKPPDYYMNYGDTYLNVFSNEIRPVLSETGKNWLDNARKNLQVELEKILKTEGIEAKDDGAVIKTLIYDSHIPAYENAGLYKDTNLLEKILIGATPRLRDGLGSSDGRKQMGIVLGHYMLFELENVGKYAP